MRNGSMAQRRNGVTAYKQEFREGGSPSGLALPKRLREGEEGARGGL
jgi:hypothetical protein